MRKLHPSYESFVKEHKPRYEKTFIEWFAENQKIGDIDLLEKLQKSNKYLKKIILIFLDILFMKKSMFVILKIDFLKNYTCAKIK